MEGLFNLHLVKKKGKMQQKYIKQRLIISKAHCLLGGDMILFLMGHISMMSFIVGIVDGIKNEKNA